MAVHHHHLTRYSPVQLRKYRHCTLINIKLTKHVERRRSSVIISADGTAGSNLMVSRRHKEARLNQASLIQRLTHGTSTLQSDMTVSAFKTQHGAFLAGSLALLTMISSQEASYGNTLQ